MLPHWAAQPSASARPQPALAFAGIDSYIARLMADTALMPIPGLIDPVPTPRGITARADGRVDLIGLPK